MRLIFAGSSKFAVPILKMLANQQKHHFIAVITQPDTKKGRGLKESISPVKQEALKHSLVIWQPKSINNPLFIKQLENSKVDLIIVVAYGQKISDDVFKIPPKGCINVHPSLLPKYRGATPVNYAILNGDKQTGITIFKIVNKMDAGDILKQVIVDIKDNETAMELDFRLATESAYILQDLLDDIEKGVVRLIPQDETKATYAPKFRKTDGEINWDKPSQQIVNQIKAMYPWPGVYTFFQSQGKSSIKVDILEAQLYAPCQQTCLTTREGLSSGSITEINNDGIIISCGQGERLDIKKLKPAGSRVLTAKEFSNGYRIKIGDRFGK
jgi:methionyl-tRNA formyltransferase